MFFTLSKEFGWTPEQIGRLSMPQLDNYFIQIREFRKYVSWSEITLEKIKNVLFKFLGAKDKKGSRTGIDKPIMGKRLEITTAEKELWAAAGYPNLEMFLKKLRGK